MITEDSRKTDSRRVKEKGARQHGRALDGEPPDSQARAVIGRDEAQVRTRGGDHHVERVGWRKQEPAKTRQRKNA